MDFAQSAVPAVPGKTRQDEMTTREEREDDHEVEDVEIVLDQDNSTEQSSVEGLDAPPAEPLQDPLFHDCTLTHLLLCSFVMVGLALLFNWSGPPEAKNYSTKCGCLPSEGRLPSSKEGLEEDLVKTMQVTTAVNGSACIKNVLDSAVREGLARTQAFALLEMEEVPRRGSCEHFFRASFFMDLAGTEHLCKCNIKGPYKGGYSYGS